MRVVAMLLLPFVGSIMTALLPTRARTVLAGCAGLVSVAAAMLQKAGLIRYSRGLVVITDRPGLEAAACNCYWVIRNEFDRLL